MEKNTTKLGGIIMNYYEHRLHEIQQEISILSTREDTKDTITMLEHERQLILDDLKTLEN